MLLDLKSLSFITNQVALKTVSELFMQPYDDQSNLMEYFKQTVRRLKNNLLKAFNKFSNESFVKVYNCMSLLVLVEEKLNEFYSKISKKIRL